MDFPILVMLMFCRKSVVYTNSIEQWNGAKWFQNNVALSDKKGGKRVIQFLLSKPFFCSSAQ